jgi:hypothetical protein
MEIKGKAFEDIIVGAEKEMNFSIDSDNSLIFEILRDKMYKDKIGSICREVLSNCRDANREAGSNQNISVTIIEPNELVYVSHQSVSFRDKGIGISPDRMADVYVKYASSTKRDSNDQTGGFGLGAKTPFAYNDTFTVITVCDVDGKRLKYYYTALIDSTRKGKMILFEVEETTDDTGTEVIVPIKTARDRSEFEEKAFYYTKFWGCVDYINFHTSTITTEAYYSSPKFDIVNSDNSLLVIDGIPYPLEIGWKFRRLNIARGYGISLKFNTGDLTISANRESVQYDPETVEIITQRCEDVYDELVVLLYQFLGNFNTYLEACSFKACIESQRLPEIKMGNHMFNIIASSIGVRNYTDWVLREAYLAAEFKFGGRLVVTNLSFKHHTLQRVVDVDTISKGSKVKVYKEYSSLPLANCTNFKMFYGDKKGDSRRNATIFDGITREKKFFIVIPHALSTEEQITEELCQLRDLYGIHYQNYSEVEQMKVNRVTATRVSSKIPASLYENYYDNGSFDLYYEKGSKKLYTDRECTNEVDHSKTCFLPVARVSSRLSYNIREKIDLIDSSIKVVLVNRENFDKKVSKCGYRTALSIYEEVVASNTNRWLEEGKKFVLGRLLAEQSLSILDYLDVLPNDILPDSFISIKAKDLKSYHNFYNSHSRVTQAIKIDESGLKDKLETSLSRFPLLVTYIEHGAGSYEDKRLAIQEYIKQVNK